MNPSEYKAIRESLKLTQAELAKKLGVTRKTVNSRENGKVVISAEAWLAIRNLKP